MVLAGRMKIGPLPGSGAWILVKLDSGHEKTPYMLRRGFGQRDQRERQVKVSILPLKRGCWGTGSGGGGAQMPGTSLRYLGRTHPPVMDAYASVSAKFHDGGRRLGAMATSRACLNDTCSSCSRQVIANK